MENRLSDTIVIPPILRLPPEILLMIYRLLLVSNSAIRMKWLHNDSYIRHLNSLLPAVLSVCHFMYSEAIDVLYGENVFQAHRIDETNKNAALVMRAQFLIGINNIKSGESDASDLAKFLDNHPKLKLLELYFARGLLEESKIIEVLSNALLTSGYSSKLRIISVIGSYRISLNAKQLVETVQQNVALLKKDHRDQFTLLCGVVKEKGELLTSGKTRCG